MRALWGGGWDQWEGCCALGSGPLKCRRGPAGGVGSWEGLVEPQAAWGLCLVRPAWAESSEEQLWVEVSGKESKNTSSHPRGNGLEMCGPLGSDVGHCSYFPPMSQPQSRFLCHPPPGLLPISCLPWPWAAPSPQPLCPQTRGDAAPSSISCLRLPHFCLMKLQGSSGERRLGGQQPGRPGAPVPDSVSVSAPLRVAIFWGVGDWWSGAGHGGHSPR